MGPNRFAPQDFPWKSLFYEQSLKQKYKAVTKAPTLSMCYSTINITTFRSLFSWWCLQLHLLEERLLFVISRTVGMTPKKASIGKTMLSSK